MSVERRLEALETEQSSEGNRAMFIIFRPSMTEERREHCLVYQEGSKRQEESDKPTFLVIECPKCERDCDQREAVLNDLN